MSWNTYAMVNIWSVAKSSMIVHTDLARYSLPLFSERFFLKNAGLENKTQEEETTGKQQNTFKTRKQEDQEKLTASFGCSECVWVCSFCYMLTKLPNRNLSTFDRSVP